MASLFQLPDEIIATTLSGTFPGRQSQIRALATLFHPNAAPCRNLIIHGTEATGKSAVTASILEELARHADLKYAIVNSIECITGRHLLERALGKVAEALAWKKTPSRCENLAQFAVELSRILLETERNPDFRMVLVLDAIDRQREAHPTLLQAMARLSEIIPCLTVAFIVTCPTAHLLRMSSVPHIHFPNYTKAEFVAILALRSPDILPTASREETDDLWARFTGAVYDALCRSAGRTLPAFKHACLALWPRFTAPVLAGTHGAREFSKLVVAARVHFQDESVLDPGIVAGWPTPTLVSPPKRTPASDEPGSKRTPRSTGTVLAAVPPTPVTTVTKTPASDLATLLPTTGRLLLLAAYLASHNAPRHDLTLFSTYHHGRRRRRGGMSGAHRGGGRAGKHRKIARKLLGAHAFVLERMLAIFTAVRSEWDAGRETGGKATAGSDGTAALDADVDVALATLASLRLLVRVGVGGDTMDRAGKWRVNVGWEVVRALGRGMGVEIEDWLIE